MMKKLIILGNKENTANFFPLLSNEGFICLKTSSEKEALNYIERESFSLVMILDVLMNIDITEICQKIRKVSDVPIIYVLDCKDRSVIVKALRSGADVCLSYPVDVEELFARIEVVLGRNKKTTQSIISINQLVWNLDLYELNYYNKRIFLAPKEFLILGLFLNHPNKVITQRELITEIWGYKASIKPRTVHSYIRNIREKLRLVGYPIEIHLETVWGIGYRWNGLGSRVKETKRGEDCVL